MYSFVTDKTRETNRDDEAARFTHQTDFSLVLNNSGSSLECACVIKNYWGKPIKVIHSY